MKVQLYKDNKKIPEPQGLLEVDGRMMPFRIDREIINQVKKMNIKPDGYRIYERHSSTKFKTEIIKIKYT